MIDNFAPQPYPLECSPDGKNWFLVIGWQRSAGGRLMPLLATVDSGLAAPDVATLDTMHYRLAGSRVVRGALEPEHERMPDRRADRPPSRA